jgi:hypothetical protein
MRSKNHQGKSGDKLQPKFIAPTGGDACPIDTFKEFKRRAFTNEDDFVFHAVNSKWNAKGKWFTSARAGRKLLTVSPPSLLISVSKDISGPTL